MKKQRVKVFLNCQTLINSLKTVIVKTTLSVELRDDHKNLGIIFKKSINGKVTTITVVSEKKKHSH